MFRWGILGLGGIARAFAEGVKSSSICKLAAVGSRSLEKARSFASEFGVNKAYGSYHELANDPEIDAIYIATPHTEHLSAALLCLNANKPILVEKPFTINTPQAESILALAREKKLFVMEAMWTRFFPLMEMIRSYVSNEELGEIKLLEADFGFRADFDPASRLFDPKLGGGALLDVGVYCVSLATMLLGAPESVVGVAELGKTGVDESNAILLKYRSGAIAKLSSSINVTTPQTAAIYGTKGTITIDSPWWRPESATIDLRSYPRKISAPYKGNGYTYEADEVAKSVQGGKLESEIMPWSQTIQTMQVMDTLRRQFGVKYPAE